GRVAAALLERLGEPLSAAALRVSRARVRAGAHGLGAGGGEPRVEDVRAALRDGPTAQPGDGAADAAAAPRLCGGDGRPRRGAVRGPVPRALTDVRLLLEVREPRRAVPLLVRAFAAPPAALPAHAHHGRAADRGGRGGALDRHEGPGLRALRAAAARGGA